MFSIFIAYIKTIVALTIFSTLASMLMPDNQFKKYTELILGLLILISILTPVFQLFGMKDPLFSDTYLSQSIQSVTEEVDDHFKEIQALHRVTEREVIAIVGDLRKGVE